MKKTIAIYPGRFQPFGPHHFKAYQWLCNKFGLDNTFIATSNSVDEDSPLNFEEKKSVILKYGIPADKIVNVKSPYRCLELTSRFDPNNTSLIMMYGAKDEGRIHYFKADGGKGYYSKYYGQKDLDPMSKNGYIIIAPDIQINHEGNEVDGSYLREVLPTLDRVGFEKLMGWYDHDLHFLFVKRFKSNVDKVIERIGNSKIGINEQSITKTQLQRIEQFADRLFKEFGIDIEFQNLYQGTHFLQRLNDPRNSSPITSDDLRALFKKVSSKYGDRLSKESPGSEGVLKDMSSDVNLPFIIKWDRQNKELDLIPKTIMKKKDFTTSSKTFAVESFKSIFEVAANAGKYTRHIIHPYEDQDLTFSGLLELMAETCRGSENPNFTYSIKVDGQNGQITVKNGKVLFSRNKGTVINPMSVEDMKIKLEDKPDNVKISFLDAHKELSEILSKVQPDKLKSFFGSGNIFLNFEILHPKNVNVIGYGNAPILMLHNFITYDEKGNEVSRSNVGLDDFISLIKPINFDVRISNQYKFSPVQQFIYFDLIDNVTNLIKKSGLNLSSKISELPDRYPLEYIVADWGNVVVNNVAGKVEGDLLATNIGDIIKRIDSLDVNRLAETEPRFSKYLKLFNDLGGVSSINPIEGIVFVWNDKQYKLTGTYSPLNMILGFDRYKK